MRLDALSKIYEKLKSNLKKINIEDEINNLEKRLEEIKNINDQDAIKLLGQEDINFYKWLFYTSIEKIQKLNEPKYQALLEIIYSENEEQKVRDFNQYLKDDENLSKFIRVFPFILTTNISSAKLGSPKIHFDLTIMDEAGQCSISNALVPIIRGKNLLLVGDPNQLTPVIVLDPNINKKLLEKYQVNPEYNYLNNSILRLMQSIDHISKYILLRYHYRSHQNIIGYSSKKYYDDQLIIETKEKIINPDSLTLLDVKSEKNPRDRNTSEYEIEAIIQTIKDQNIKNFGIISPFRNQAELIKKKFKENGINYNEDDIGTIHTFQGDEKDVIFITTAISEKTPDKTFDWVKDNRELLNVGATRAKNRLILTTDYDEIKKRSQESNDLFDLVEYVKTKGKNEIKVNLDELYKKQVYGYKNYNTKTEEEFLETITHYLTTTNNYYVKDKVKVSSIFNRENTKDISYFLTSEFDFVIFEKGSNKPILVFELDGLEHFTDEKVIERDLKKQQICKERGLILKRLPNHYARRYQYIKDAIKNIFN